MSLPALTSKEGTRGFFVAENNDLGIDKKNDLRYNNLRTKEGEALKIQGGIKMSRQICEREHMNVYLTDKKEEMELGRDIWDIISEDPEEAGFIWDAEQDRWTCDAENYAWWDRVADDLAAADALKVELSDKGIDYRRELDEALEYVHDIDERAAVMRGTLEKIAAEYDREKPEFEIVVDGEIIDTVKAWDADSAVDIWQNSADGWRYLERYSMFNGEEASVTVREKA